MKTILLLMLLLAGCSSTNVTGSTVSGCGVTEYGNHVYYFHCTNAFGEALANFRKTHEIVTLTGYAPAGNWGTTGYFVVTK